MRNFLKLLTCILPKVENTIVREFINTFVGNFQVDILLLDVIVIHTRPLLLIASNLLKILRYSPPSLHLRKRNIGGKLNLLQIFSLMSLRKDHNYFRRRRRWTVSSLFIFRVYTSKRPMKIDTLAVQLDYTKI